MEKLTSVGISINATVSFTVPQALEVADAIERGLETANNNGVDTSTVTPYVTIMVGRIDDHLKRLREAENVDIDPELINWASIAIFKNAYTIFKDRGYKSKLLAAAFRCDLHWKEIVGGDVIISMPYDWWNQFNKSDVEVIDRMEQPVDKEIISTLRENFVDFNRAFDKDGMHPEEFLSFGATVHTMNTFLDGYDEFISLIRNHMIKE